MKILPSIVLAILLVFVEQQQSVCNILGKKQYNKSGIIIIKTRVRMPVVEKNLALWGQFVESRWQVCPARVGY